MVKRSSPPGDRSTPRSKTPFWRRPDVVLAILTMVGTGGLAVYDRYQKLVEKHDQEIAEVRKDEANRRLALMGEVERKFASMEAALMEMRQQIAVSSERANGLLDENQRLKKVDQENKVLRGQIQAAHRDRDVAQRRLASVQQNNQGGSNNGGRAGVRYIVPASYYDVQALANRAQDRSIAVHKVFENVPYPISATLPK